MTQVDWASAPILRETLKVEDFRWGQWWFRACNRDSAQSLIPIRDFRLRTHAGYRCRTRQSRLGNGFPLGALFRVSRRPSTCDAALELRGASFALSIGDWIFTNLPFAPSEKGAFGSHAAYPVGPLGSGRTRSTFRQVRASPVGGSHRDASRWTGFCNRCERPRADTHILHPAASWSSRRSPGRACYGLLCVWSVFAGAMTRIAAVEQATGNAMALSGALRFSLENFLSYMRPHCSRGRHRCVLAVMPPIVRLDRTDPVHWTAGARTALGLELVFGFLMALILIAASQAGP